MPSTGERRFKRGQIVCKPGEMEMNMYNILYGSVGIYTDYGKPDEVEVVTLREGDFFNVMGLPLCRLGAMLKEQGVVLL